MITAALLACAANVAPVTLEAIIQVESSGNPLAVNVNGLRVQPAPAATLAEATAVAKSYIARGYSVDLGLMQVNSGNLASLGLTIQEAFDPCTNIRGAGEILTANYVEAARTRGPGQIALQAALSAYNTGDFHRGFGNGYVARYYGANGVPALAGHLASAHVTKTTAQGHTPPPNPFTADTSVFVRDIGNVRIQ